MIERCTFCAGDKCEGGCPVARAYNLDKYDGIIVLDGKDTVIYCDAYGPNKEAGVICFILRIALCALFLVGICLVSPWAVIGSTLGVALCWQTIRRLEHGY